MTSRTILPRRQTLALDKIPGEISRAAESYLASKQKRLTARSEAGYRRTLEIFAEAHTGRPIADLEPPDGSFLIEDFLGRNWGQAAPRTYNKGHSVLCGFFKHLVARGVMVRDPMLTIERAKTRPAPRQTFSELEQLAIFAANPDPRDQVALHLLLDYGIRKGALAGVKFGDFDPYTRKLLIFTKGEKYQRILIPDGRVWELLREIDGEPTHHLLPRQVMRRRRPPEKKTMTKTSGLIAEAIAACSSITDPLCAHELGDALLTLQRASIQFDLVVATASLQQSQVFPEERMGEHGLHDWWYRRLQRAGLVPKGITRGRKIHSARHTAAQRILEATGNLRAAQKALGHAHVSTTEVYTDVSDDQLEEALIRSLGLDRGQQHRELGVGA